VRLEREANEGNEQLWEAFGGMYFRAKTK